MGPWSYSKESNLFLKRTDEEIKVLSWSIGLMMMLMKDQNRVQVLMIYRLRIDFLI